MTWDWTSQFENAPIGGDFGAVTAYEIRRHKVAFEERFIKEHNMDVDPGTSLVVTHKVGECAIVNVSPEDPIVPSLVDGALQWDGSLKRDTGVILEVAATTDHLGLIGVTTEDEHPKYVHRIHTDGYDELTGELDLQSLYKITALPTTEDAANTTVLSRGAHLGDHGSGGAKHNADHFEVQGEAIGARKIKFVPKVKILTLAHLAQVTVTFGGYSTFPGILWSNYTGNDAFKMLARSGAAGYNGNISFTNTSGATRIMHFYYWELEAA